MKIDPKHLAFANVIIRTEVKRLRERGVIRRADAEDIASAVITQLLAAWPSFDPDRGPPEAFINQVVNTRLVSLLRERNSQKRRATTEPIHASDDRPVDHSSSGEGSRRMIELRVDLRVALDRLTPKQREICDQLMREAITPAARQMGVPRSTLRDAVARIREVFRDAGLEEYF